MRATHLAAAALLAAGCSPGAEPVRACTMIGCEDGLEVTVEGAPAGPFRVEAALPGSAAPRVFECPAAGECGGRAFFAGFTPDSVIVRVIVAGDTTTRALRPQYRTAQPNGSGCPPVCRQATVRVVHGASVAAAAVAPATLSCG